MTRRKTYPEPRINTAVRLPQDLHRQLQEAADRRDLSINYLLVKAARYYLARLPPLEASLAFPDAPTGGTTDVEG